MALTLLSISAAAAVPTAFVKVGDAPETVQEFFPGEHRARMHSVRQNP